MSAPNIDEMIDDELEVFVNRHLGGNNSSLLFPDARWGSVYATRTLAKYAFLLMFARQARVEGRIQAAVMYEGDCDRLFNLLPEWARW